MTRTTITVPTVDGDRDVAAFVFGNWAAHEAVEPHDIGIGWTVTHVPTGLRANSHPSIGYCDEARAIRIAQQLDADGVTTHETPVMSGENVMSTSASDMERLRREIRDSVRRLT